MVPDLRRKEAEQCVIMVWVAGRSDRHFFYLAHILCSCTRQYECDDVLDGFWGPGDGCWPDTGSEMVPVAGASTTLHPPG